MAKAVVVRASPNGKDEPTARISSRPSVIHSLTVISPLHASEPPGDAMPAKRTIDPVDLLQWERDGLNTEEMRQRLAEDGKPVSIELVRLRLREAHQASAGAPPKPKAERKASATARRQQQVASAVDVLEELRDDLQNLIDSWGDTFAGTDRYQRFSDAVAVIEEAVASLGDLDLSWNGS